MKDAGVDCQERGLTAFGRAGLFGEGSIVRHEKVVERCLKQIASGKRELVPNLLRLLCDEIVYTPVVMFENLGDALGTNRIRVASFVEEGRKIVPVFTAEEFFLEWSDGKYQCFSVTGGDLALTLPKSSWIVINPGRSASVELNPEEIVQLSQAEPLSTDSSSQDVQEQEQSTNEQSLEVPTRELAFDADEFRRHDLPEFEQEETPEVSLPEADLDGLCSGLSQLLSRYSEVDEAYFHEARDGGGRAAVGLLLKHVAAERRFMLIDGIAELSRRYYGSAGAIEVFDDLYVTSSKSWELFSALTPFYVKGDEDERPVRKSGLLLEREFYPAEDEDDLFAEEDSSAWQAVKKTGVRFLGALRLVPRD